MKSVTKKAAAIGVAAVFAATAVPQLRAQSQNLFSTTVNGSTTTITAKTPQDTFSIFTPAMPMAYFNHPDMRDEITLKGVNNVGGVTQFSFIKEADGTTSLCYPSNGTNSTFDTAAFNVGASDQFKLSLEVSTNSINMYATNFSNGTGFSKTFSAPGVWYLEGISRGQENYPYRNYGVSEIIQQYTLINPNPFAALVKAQPAPAAQKPQVQYAYSMPAAPATVNGGGMTPGEAQVEQVSDNSTSYGWSSPAANDSAPALRSEAVAPRSQNLKNLRR